MAINKKQVGLGMLSGMMLGAVALGTYGVSAQDADTSDDTSSASHAHFGGHGKRLSTTADVLGISTDELREQLEASTLEEVVTNNGFDSLEDFQAAVEERIRERLAERGLSEEEIDERIAKKNERRELKEDIKTAREQVLGLTREEVKEQREQGQTFEEIVQAAGFDSVEAFHDAVKEAVAEIWVSEDVDQDTIDERLERLDEKFERRGEKPNGFNGPRGGFGPRSS